MKLHYFIIPAIVILVAVIGSYFTSSGMEWYKTINLPNFTPPGYIIGIVWNIIFILTTISAIIVWNNKPSNLIIGIFLANAFLNVFWSFLFFNQGLIGAAFFEAILLDISVWALFFLIWPISKLASCLLLPYGLWVAFASFLNFMIWLKN